MGLAFEPLNGNVIRVVADDAQCRSGCGVHVELADIGSNRWTAVALPWKARDLITPDDGAVDLVRTGHRAFIWLARSDPRTAFFSSSDEGHTWSRHLDPCMSSSEHAMDQPWAAPDGSLVIACWTSTNTNTDAAVLMTSSDGGQTWKRGPVFKSAWLDVAPATAATVVDVASDSLVGDVRTTDRGAHWSHIDLGMTDSGYCIFQTTTVGHCISQSGDQLATTTDAGATWSVRPVGD
jgi:hypothetical protein